MITITSIVAARTIIHVANSDATTHAFDMKTQENASLEKSILNQP